MKIDLINNKKDREKFMERVDVLNKVKEIITLPEKDVLTTQMIADYYEVGIEAIKKCYQRNKEELESDGIWSCKGKEIKDFYVRDTKSPTSLNIVSNKSGFVINGVSFRNNSNLIFSTRALLRIGMLLRDSDIAKEVRTQLLNGYEKLTEEQKTNDIDKELELMHKIGEAYGTGDITKILIATNELDSYRKRKILEQKEVIDILSTETLNYADKDFCNAIVRKIAKNSMSNIGDVYVNLWHELLYSDIHIDIATRRKNRKTTTKNGKEKLPTMYEVINEEELCYIIKYLVSWCKKENIDISDIINKNKNNLKGE